MRNLDVPDEDDQRLKLIHGSTSAKAHYLRELFPFGLLKVSVTGTAAKPFPCCGLCGDARPGVEPV